MMPPINSHFQATSKIANKTVGAFGNTNLFNETFEGESNNAASGTDTGGINWYTDNGDNDATEFFVHNQGTNKEFHAINNSGLGALYTDTIDISTYTDLNFSIVIDRTQNLSSTDYIQFSYRLDNASEKVTIDKINDDIFITSDSIKTYHYNNNYISFSVFSRVSCKLRYFV